MFWDLLNSYKIGRNSGNQLFLRKQENISSGTNPGHPLLWGQPKTNVDISSTKMIEWVCSFVYICFACIQAFWCKRNN